MSHQHHMVIVAPCFNAERNIDNLVDSIASQTCKDWSLYLIDDMSEDDTYSRMTARARDDLRITVVKNQTKKYALRNIVETARQYQGQDHTVIGVVDGDDQLCNDKALDIVLDDYDQNGLGVVWSAHRWDIDGRNISGAIPDDVDPYQIPWRSSHLRTFSSKLLESVSDDNFKDWKGDWFKRGYDQILTLPLLKVSPRRKYISEVCYQYNLDSVSIPLKSRNWTEREQINSINFIRARGFIT